MVHALQNKNLEKFFILRNNSFAFNIFSVPKKAEEWQDMENQIIKTGLKNTLFVVAAQAVNFVLGIAKALVLPIVLGITNFGYWQVYLLYVSYAGLFALGFNDGIYLRYGKYNYQDLPKPVFRSTIRFFIIIQLITMIVISLLIPFEPDASKQIAMMWVSINIPIAGLSGVLIYVLQVTNQLKKYSFYTIIDKFIVLLVILIIFIIKIDKFILVIVVDTFSKVIVLGLMAYSCKEIIFGKGCELKTAYKEFYKNISVGIKLMLANLTGMLVLGFGRFIVERFESVEVYATYSFAISTINLVLIFLTAIGLVIYPTLNRLEDNLYPKYFLNLNQLLSVIVFGLLLAYFPLRVFISKYMVEYVGIFEYLPIVFTIIFIQTKMQILINPFYKLLREEKAMLNANVIGLLMAAILVVPFYFISRSVLMVAVGTVIAMSIRLYFSEVYLKKILSLNNNLNFLVESLGIMIFILFAYQSNLLISFLGCFTAFCFYLISQIKTITRFAQYFSRG